MFLISFNICMRGKNDLSGYCDPLGIHKSPMTQKVNFEAMKDSMMQLFGSVQQAKYFEPNPVGCHFYTKEEIVNYNFYVWTIAMYIGLQFSHVSNISWFKYWVIDFKDMKNWTIQQWTILIVILIAIASILITLFHDYTNVGCLTYYAVVAMMIGSWFYFKSRKAYDVHIHHYVIAIVVLCFTGY